MEADIPFPEFDNKFDCWPNVDRGWIRLFWFMGEVLLKLEKLRSLKRLGCSFDFGDVIAEFEVMIGNLAWNDGVCGCDWSDEFKLIGDWVFGEDFTGSISNELKKI